MKILIIDNCSDCPFFFSEDFPFEDDKKIYGCSNLGIGFPKEFSANRNAKIYINCPLMDVDKLVI